MRRKFLSILGIISGLFVSWSVQAKPVLAPATASNSQTYYAYMEANGNFETPSEFFRSLLSDSKESLQLKTLFEAAQQSYFTQKKAVALSKYKDAFSLLTQADWSSSQRQILFFAGLRISQLSEGSHQQKWLQVTANYFPEMKVDSEVFPPPFLSKYASAQNQRASQIVEIGHLAEDFQWISVNGVGYNLESLKEVDFPLEKSRVTLYSDIYQPVSKILTPSEFVNWTPLKTPLVSGDCNSPKLELDAAKQASVFFGLHCIKVIRGDRSLLVSQTSPSMKRSFDHPLNKALQHNSTHMEQPSQWWQNKWVWWGVAAAGAAYMIYDHNQNSSSSEQSPTTTYKD